MNDDIIDEQIVDEIMPLYSEQVVARMKLRKWLKNHRRTTTCCSCNIL